MEMVVFKTVILVMSGYNRSLDNVKVLLIFDIHIFSWACVDAILKGLDIMDGIYKML